MKIYADYSHYLGQNRKYLIEILRPVWNDSLLDKKKEVYGEWVSSYSFTEEIENADICFLPMTWDYYVEKDLIPLAKTAVEQAKNHSKPIILFKRHDFTARLPFSDVILFEQSGYRSEQEKVKCFGVPAFFPDYLQLYCSGRLEYRHKNDHKLKVGFCGAVSQSLYDITCRLSIHYYHKIEFYLGISKWEPPRIPSYIFRKRVLDVFSKNNLIETNYILRKQFKAGMINKNENDPTRLAFLQNILGSDYTICVRGEGNYSYRFYETLDLGRIPVFIDTDCLLPWDKTINYHDYFPWIEYHENSLRRREIVRLSQFTI